MLRLWFFYYSHAFLFHTATFWHPTSVSKKDNRIFLNTRPIHTENFVETRSQFSELYCWQTHHSQTSLIGGKRVVFFETSKVSSNITVTCCVKGVYTLPLYACINIVFVACPCYLRCVPVATNNVGTDRPRSSCLQLIMTCVNTHVIHVDACSVWCGIIRRWHLGMLLRPDVTRPRRSTEGVWIRYHMLIARV